MFTHEKLEVYGFAIQFLRFVKESESQIPRGHADLADQLRRAAISIPLTIAEGAGRVGFRDKARFFAMARGSALECAAVIDVLAVLGGDDSRLVVGRELLMRIARMLTGLCR